MKKIIHILNLIALLLLLSAVPPLAARAEAPPPLPSSFWGTAKAAGLNVPAGTEVTAWINGVQYAKTVTLLYKDVSVYSLNVPGDIVGTPAKEGGVAGDTVIFKISGAVSTVTAPWVSGTNVEKNLVVEVTMTTTHKIYLPFIVHTS